MWSDAESDRKSERERLHFGGGLWSGVMTQLSGINLNQSLLAQAGLVLLGKWDRVTSRAECF